MDVVAVVNYKGGVGKTTLTANLGAELAARGKNVLLIDFDPQISLTLSFYAPQEWEARLRAHKTLKNWFDSYESSKPVRIADIVDIPPRVEQALKDRGRLDVVAAHFALIDEDARLYAAYTQGKGVVDWARSRVKVRERLYRELLDPIVSSSYDFVLIDCPPNLNLATRMALVASSHVLTPTRADYLSTIGLRYLFESYHRIIEAHAEDVTMLGLATQPPPPRPLHLGVLFTMVQFSRPDRPYARQAQAMSSVRGDPYGYPTFDRVLRYNNANYDDAGDGGVPVALLNTIDSNVAADLDQIATEFLKRIGDNEGVVL